MKNITTFQEHLQNRYGAVGTERRDTFEANSKAFAIGELLKEARIQANMTQTELALKAGTTKNYISRIENGHSDIQLSTLIKIIESGLGRQFSFAIR
jgi:DNA-binding XRE family transcriptional regulator